MPLNTPLSNVQELVERSLYHSIRRQCVAKGYLPDVTLYTGNSNAEFQRFEADLADIRTNKGFAIEVFGHSSAQEKWLKKTPRIVILPNMAVPGTLGGAMDRQYEGNGPVLSESGFTSYILPPQTTDFYYDVHVVYEKAEQGRVINSLIALGLPMRGYIDTVDNYAGIIQDQKFFMRLLDSRNLGLNSQGQYETVYTYEVPDIFEIERIVINPSVPAIREITIITENPEDTDLTSSTIT